MSILTMIITIVVVGLVLWLINTFIPMEAGIKKLLNVFVVVVLGVLCLVFILNLLGVSLNAPLLRR